MSRKCYKSAISIRRYEAAWFYEDNLKPDSYRSPIRCRCLLIVIGGLFLPISSCVWLGKLMIGAGAIFA